MSYTNMRVELDINRVSVYFKSICPSCGGFQSDAHNEEPNCTVGDLLEGGGLICLECGSSLTPSDNCYANLSVHLLKPSY